MTETATIFVYVEGEKKEWIDSVKKQLCSEENSIVCQYLELSNKEVFGDTDARKQAIERLKSKCMENVSHVFIFLSDTSGIDEFWSKGFVVRIVEEIKKSNKDIAFVDHGISQNGRDEMKSNYEKIHFLQAILNGDTVREVCMEIKEYVYKDASSLPHSSMDTVDSPVVTLNGTRGPFSGSVVYLEGGSTSCSSTTDPDLGILPGKLGSAITPKGRYLYIAAYHQFDHKGLDYRPTGLIDAKVVKECFEGLGFKVSPKIQSTADETREFFKDSAKSLSECKAEIVVCAISSHGEERLEAKVHEKSEDQQSSTQTPRKTEDRSKTKKHYIYCRDGEVVETAEIMSYFQIPQLRDVPKLFLIQACSSTSGRDEKTFVDYGTNVLVSVNSEDLDTDNVSLEGEEDSLDARAIRLTGVKGKLPEPPVSLPEPSTAQKSSVAEKQEVGVLVSDDVVKDKSSAKITLNGDSTRQQPGRHQNTKDVNVYSVQEETFTVGKEIQTSYGKATISEETKVISKFKNAEEVYHKEELTTLVEQNDELEIPVSHEETVYFPEICPCNAVVVFASASGKFAYSNPSEGGRLFMALKEALTENRKSESTEIDILELLTNVTHRCSHYDIVIKGEEEKIKCVSSVHHRLKKDIVLSILPQQK